MSLRGPAAADPALASTRTGYGQGGSRVTDSNGIGKSGGRHRHPTRCAAGQLMAGQGSAALLAAQLAATGGMTKAALELSGGSRETLLANGGRHVAVINLPDFVDTPFGAAVTANPQSAALAPVPSALSENFNLWLREGLTDQPIRIVDPWAFIKLRKARPATCGLVHVTAPTRRPATQRRRPSSSSAC